MRLRCLLGHRWGPWRNESFARVAYRTGKPYRQVDARRCCERCPRVQLVTLRGRGGKPYTLLDRLLALL